MDIPDSPKPHLSIHHVHLFVRDLDRSVHFLTKQLGFKLLYDFHTSEGGRFTAVAPPDGTTILGLSAPAPGSPDAELIGRSGHMVLVTDDVGAKYEEWTANGVVFRSPPVATSWRGVVAGFTDPDGNPFTLMSHDDISRKLEEDRRDTAVREERRRQGIRDMAIAREVQAQLFPQTPPAARTLDIAGRCAQARQIGGDYFDFLPLGRDWIGLLIGDISGKGIAAALLMANLQASVRSQSAVALDDPQRFLESVNGHLFHNSPSGSYATLFLGQYCDETGELRYFNCGHTPGLLLRANGQLEELPSTSTVLGLFRSWEYAIHETRLNPGDTLALYTDGVTECFDRNGDEFGTERLVEILRRSTSSAPQLLEEIFDELRAFGGPEQQDDITLMIARCRRA
jgi:serine phosphatase RsbU (regulator of sigma subunit)/predicted enzyme related to lactoylglutathione lyase